MKNYQVCKINMFGALDAFFTLNSKILSALINFPALLLLYKSKYDIVNKSAEKHVVNNSGTTALKKSARVELIKLSYSCAVLLNLFAKATKSKELELNVTLSLNEFQRMSDQVLKLKAMDIYDSAQKNIAALTTYGITAATQTTFLNAINAFAALLPKVRLNSITKTQDTTNLKTAISDLDVVIKSIDEVIESIRFTNVELYETYYNTRKIIISGGQSLTIKCKVIDADTGKPIPDAIVTLTPIVEEVVEKNNSLTENALLSTTVVTTSKETKKAEPIVKKSAAKGGFNIKSINNLKYMLTCEKAKFEVANKTIELSPNELNSIEIKLVKKK